MEQNMEFFTLYQKVMSKYSRLLGSGSPSFILPENIDLKQMVVSSLTNPGDKVLILENGTEGHAFYDLVKAVGGKPVKFALDAHLALPAEPLRNFLKKETGFKFATLVHCEKASGMLNDVQTLCPILKENGILPVVDSAFALFGNPLDVRRARIDILLGETSGVLSCTNHLPLVTVSHEAFHKMEGTSSHDSLLCFKNWQKERAFPYDIPTETVNEIGSTLDAIDADKALLLRHTRVSAAVRAALIAGGLALYGKDGFSGTFSAFRVPRETTASALLQALQNTPDLPIFDSSALLQSPMLTIDHTGTNGTEEKMLLLLNTLSQVLPSLGFPLKGDMLKAFRYHITDPRN